MPAQEFLPEDDSGPSATLPLLKVRSRLLAATREFFDGHGYWEVETPILSHDTVVDAHLEPFVVQTGSAFGTRNPCELYLQTSPEFGMKRLLAAGADAIYQITRAFRSDEIGRYHNPEFTMIEWYRVGDSHREQMDFVEQYVCSFFETARGLARQPSTADQPERTHPAAFSRPFRRLTYDEALEQHAGSRILEATMDELMQLARRHKVRAPESLAADDRDGWLNLLLAEVVEPSLGQDNPEFLYDYPASQAALAKIGRVTPPVAERFELYLGGIEVCNGYHELTDACELKRRIDRQSLVRAQAGRRPLKQANRLLHAMQQGLPDCAGVALGFDRLVMLATGADSLAEVMAFPFERA